MRSKQLVCKPRKEAVELGLRTLIKVKPPPANPGAYTGEPLKGGSGEPLKRLAIEQAHLLEVLVSLLLCPDVRLDHRFV